MRWENVRFWGYVISDETEKCLFWGIVLQIYKNFKKIKKSLKKVLTYEKHCGKVYLAFGKTRNARNSGCGSAWLERLIWDQEVAGSNPVTPTFMRV